MNGRRSQVDSRRSGVHPATARRPGSRRTGSPGRRRNRSPPDRRAQVRAQPAQHLARVRAPGRSSRCRRRRCRRRVRGCRAPGGRARPGRPPASAAPDGPPPPPRSAPGRRPPRPPGARLEQEPRRPAPVRSRRPAPAPRAAARRRPAAPPRRGPPGGGQVAETLHVGRRVLRVVLGHPRPRARSRALPCLPGARQSGGSAGAAPGRRRPGCAPVRALSGGPRSGR